MKKLILLLLTILLCLQLLIGCARKTADIYSKNTSEETTESSSEETSTEITEEDVDETTSQEFNEEVTSETMSNPDRLNGIDVQPVNHNNVKIWPDGIELGFQSSFNDVYGVDYLNTTQYIPDEFIDVSAEKTLQMTILGTEYTLIYNKSLNMPTADYVVHIYDVQDTEKGQIYIDTKTGQVIKYSAIPYDMQYFSSEKDYTDVIEELVGIRCNLSKFSYKCITTYHNENSFGNEHNGFRTLTENERFFCYEFYYQTFVNDIITNEHITAIFFNDSHFILEIWDFGYEANTFAQTINNMNKLESHIEEYLNESLISDYSIQNIEFFDPQLFVKDGIVYVYLHVSYNVTKGSTSSGMYDGIYIVSALGPI